MFEFINTVFAFGYLAVALFGTAGMLRMSAWDAYMILNSGRESFNFFSTLFYLCVGYLVFQNPGIAGGILAAIIIIPIFIGWVNGGRSVRYSDVNTALRTALVLVLVQIACLAIVVF